MLRLCWVQKMALTAGKRERMWCVLRAVLPGPAHMLAPRGDAAEEAWILVLDTHFGGAWNMEQCGL